MNYLLDLLAESRASAEYALDLKGRSLSLMFATCTNNKDPLGMRRIKVALESKAGLVDSDWALRLPINPYHDAPLPLPGTSVLVAAIDGDPHDLVWLGAIMNDTNPADDQQRDYVNDNSLTVPGDNKLKIDRNDTQAIGGDRTTTVMGNYIARTVQDETRTVEGTHTHTVEKQEIRRTDQNLNISCGQAITFTTDSGASLTLGAAGSVVLADAFGHKWTLGGDSWEWDLNGASVQIVNAGGMTINGHQVATVGARDSDNDTLVTRGY